MPNYDLLVYDHSSLRLYILISPWLYLHSPWTTRWRIRFFFSQCPFSQHRFTSYYPRPMANHDWSTFDPKDWDLISSIEHSTLLYSKFDYRSPRVQVSYFVQFDGSMTDLAQSSAYFLPECTECMSWQSIYRHSTPQIALLPKFAWLAFVD